MVKSNYDNLSSVDKKIATKALIARVREITGLDNKAIAHRLALSPETMRKQAGGYHPASPQTYQLLGELLSRPEEGTSRGREEIGQHSAWAKNSLPYRVERLLHVATTAQVEALRGVVELLEATVGAAMPLPASKPVILSGDFELVAMERIAAGFPAEGGKVPGEVVAVPREKMKGVDSALRVHGDSMIEAGIHHGDIVLLSRTKEPRRGDIVAARCDHTEVTLKRYDVRNGKPVLSAANKAFGIPVAWDETMEILGVMLRKL